MTHAARTKVLAQLKRERQDGALVPQWWRALVPLQSGPGRHCTCLQRHARALILRSGKLEFALLRGD